VLADRHRQTKRLVPHQPHQVTKSPPQPQPHPNSGALVQSGSRYRELSHFWNAPHRQLQGVPLEWLDANNDKTTYQRERPNFPRSFFARDSTSTCIFFRLSLHLPAVSFESISAPFYNPRPSWLQRRTSTRLSCRRTMSERTCPSSPGC
jgi:hypothetical protein